MFARNPIRAGLFAAALCTAAATVSFAQMDDAKPMAGMKAAMGGGDAAMIAQLKKVQSMPEMAGDKLFVLGNADGNMFEVALSKLVASKTQSDKVKDLTAMIIKDHSAANEKLAPIAKKMGLELAPDITALQQAKLDVLATIPPADLDKAYLGMQRAIHAHDITMFADHATMAKDDGLKSYISETLPHLKEHGAHINMVASDMNAGAKDTPADMVKGKM